MATIEDVRALALALPGAEEIQGPRMGEPAWRCNGRGFVWLRPPRASDLRQLDALGQSWPEGPVLAVRTETVALAGALTASDPDIFFTIPHFAGYPAVLVRLEAIDREYLGELISDAWLLRAPKTVARQWLAERGLN